MSRILKPSILLAASVLACWQATSLNSTSAQTLLPIPEDGAYVQGDAVVEGEPIVEGDYIIDQHAEAMPVDAGQMGPRDPDLFYNYYVNGAGSVPAAMYPAPLPVPPNVGHVYYTYQPFYPHETMYPHYRVYVNDYGYYHGYDGNPGYGSSTQAVVRWQRGTMRPFYFPRFQAQGVPRNPFLFRP